MSQHTKGPWWVGQHPAIPDSYIVKPVLFGSRVRVLHKNEGGHVSLKNAWDARLIAAAPELLGALEEAVRQYGKTGGPWNVPRDPGGWIAKAEAAIKKARGE